MLVIGPWETYFNEILIKIHQLSFKKMRLKMSSGSWQPFYLIVSNLLPVGQNGQAMTPHFGFMFQ